MYICIYVYIYIYISTAKYTCRDDRGFHDFKQLVKNLAIGFAICFCGTVRFGSAQDQSCIPKGHNIV